MASKQQFTIFSEGDEPGHNAQNPSRGNTCTIAAILEVPNVKGRPTHMNWKRLIVAVLTALAMMAATYILPRGGTLREASGGVSHDSRSMGDFRVALREIEITSCSVCGVNRIAFSMDETTTQEVTRSERRTERRSIRPERSQSDS